MENQPQLAIVGATGMVGREIVNQLAQRDYNATKISLFSAEHSEIEEADFGEEVLPIDKVTPRSFKGVKVVILATPASAAKALAVAAQQEGAWVIDLSGAYHDSASVPLVAPGFNDAALETPFAGRIVTLASSVSQLVAFALEPLRRALELAEVQATVMLGAASAGIGGQRALEKQTADLMGGREPDISVFPHRLAFNLVPEVGAITDGRSAQERALEIELSRLWAPNAPKDLCPTLFWTPTFHGVVASLSVRTVKALPAGDLTELFKGFAGVHVLDKPDEHIYPMPMLVTGDSTVHVGRIRQAATRLHLVAAVDNVGRAAAGAVELALKLGKRA
jgi:aspartate-semialdehyde dehydrogenase